jgi:hypothetical protein
MAELRIFTWGAKHCCKEEAGDLKDNLKVEEKRESRREKRIEGRMKEGHMSLVLEK